MILLIIGIGTALGLVVLMVRNDGGPHSSGSLRADQEWSSDLPSAPYAARSAHGRFMVRWRRTPKTLARAHY